MSPKADFSQIGMTGLPTWGGVVYDEWLKDLQGSKGRRVIREMCDNDAMIGAVLFSLETLIRQTDWEIKEGKDAAASQFIFEAFYDMDRPWAETLSEILSFFRYGWSLHETLFKIRDGKNSPYNDKKIGWQGWPIRGQETLLKWDFSPYGDILAMRQLGPPDFKEHVIPMEKALLFRTTTQRNSPEGRALDPTTPIPTPNGWKHLDDLHVGGAVFDEMGRIRYITDRADWQDRPCYLVTFNDGSEIVADAEHQWVTQLVHERSTRTPGKVRTTAEIAATVKNSNGVSNHSIPWAQPLQYPEQHYIMDPYVLGLWLGDGYSNAMQVACHADDAEETASLIGAAGYGTNIVHNGPDGCLGRSIRVYGEKKWDASGPAAVLNVLGLKGNKHIPTPYLRGSIDQRRALLAGLMDSDGHVDPYGRCEFVNTNRNLIDGVAELVRSLGVGAAVRLRKRAGSPGHVQDAWAVRFTPPWTPFRLVRKTVKTLNERARTNHYIVSCESVAPRRTVCIEVDGPSHLFLAGEAMVPTHNSLLRNAYRSWYFKKRIEAIEGIGIERDLAGLPVAMVPPELLAENASADDKKMLETIKQIVTNIRRDEQEGVVWPLAYDPDAKLPIFDLKLLSTGGRRQFDTDAIIARYDQRITMTTLADFITLGHERVGSNAMAEAKSRLFTAALRAWLGSICGVINQYAIPRLLRLNGYDVVDPPRLEHGDIERSDIDQLSNAILRIRQAGGEMDLSLHGDVMNRVLEILRLPAPGEDAENTIADPGSDTEDAQKNSAPPAAPGTPAIPQPQSPGRRKPRPAR